MILFDISSKMSCMTLKAPCSMVPFISKVAISTNNQYNASLLAIPKQPLNPYFRFAKDIRPQIVKQNPNLKQSEVSKILAQKYNELPIPQKKELSQAYLIDKKNYSQIFEQFKK